MLLADEPTGNLDATTGQEIIELLFERRAETGATLLMITHDLGIVRSVAHRVAVMKDGEIVRNTWKAG